MSSPGVIVLGLPFYSSAAYSWTRSQLALLLNMNDLPSLLRNDGSNKQNWIKTKLVGTKCNRTASARVVTGKHVQIDEVHSGSSVMS